MTRTRSLPGALAAAFCSLLLGAVLAGPALAQGHQTAPATRSPDFAIPDGADPNDDPWEWMLQPAFRDALNTQMLAASDAARTELARSPSFQQAMTTLDAFFNLGPSYAYAVILGEDDALYLSYGMLYKLSGGSVPFFDPSTVSRFDMPTLEAFNLSPSGRTVAVAVGDAGREIAEVYFVDLKSGRIRRNTAGPVVIGGDTGFVWIDESTGMFRKAGSTDLVGGDPSVGAEWTLYNINTGRAGAAVFHEGAEGVETEFGDWFGVWVPAGGEHAMGYLWRGNFIDAYVADLDGVRAGNPVWQEVAGDLSISDVEIWNDHFIITGVDTAGRSNLYAEPVGGGRRFLIARGEGSDSFLYTASMGDTAFVAARRGDHHVLYRMRNGQFDLQEVELPFEGEIDFQSMYEITGTGGSITFDMSAPDRPWRLVRLDRSGPAYEFYMPFLGTEENPRLLAGITHRLDHVTSADGARVPMSIVLPEDTDGATFPALIHAYGSYGETVMAGWNPTALAWVSLGGVYAECHVRGSGYYGPAWHAGGSGADKTRSHEDMIACGEHLVELGLAQPGDIAAMGASAGGLIAGPVSINRPDLFGAAIVEFGVVNPLRGLDGPNGATQIDEFGDPGLPSDALLMAGSDSVELARTAEILPDMFLCVGFQDSRVPHWMSARLAAVMAERELGNDIIIHANADAGHSCGYFAEDQREAVALQFAWLLDRLED